MPQEFHLSQESAKLNVAIVNLLKSKPQGKKYVAVQFFINRIFKVDDVSETVSLDFYLKLNWISEQWRGKTDDDFQANEKKFDPEVWWEPGVEVTNGIEIEKQVDHDEAFWLEYPNDGILAYTQRYIGTISAPMQLKQFPFDSQVFSINFESFHWKAEDCELLRLPAHALQYPPKSPLDRWITMSEDVRLQEWNIQSIEVKEVMKRYEFEDRTYSQAQVCVSIKRKYGYYVLKLMSILLLIVIMCWTVFLIPPQQFSDRLSIIVTLFLSAVAFNFVGASAIPRISYMTQFDLYVIWSYVLIVLVVVESSISFLYFTYAGDRGMFKWANPVDGISIFLFPLATLAFNVVFVFNVFYSQSAATRVFPCSKDDKPTHAKLLKSSEV
jgi:hypothetical protein